MNDVLMSFTELKNKIYNIKLKNEDGIIGKILNNIK